MSLTLFIATDTVMNDLVWVELNAMFYFVFCWGVRGGVLRKSFSYLLYKTNFKSRKKKKEIRYYVSSSGPNTAALHQP